MIASPVYYYRQSEHDVPALPSHGFDRLQNIATAALPILNFYAPLRTPLSIGLGGFRSITHLQNIFTSIGQKDFFKTSACTVQLFLSLSGMVLVITSVVTPHFNPAFGMILCGADDLIGNLLELITATKEPDAQKLAEIIARLLSTILYTAYITFGRIEILATCMLLQIASHLHKSIDEFRKGHLIEGGCHAITSLLTLNQAIPQLKVIEWKWRTEPTLEGELCRDGKGFVYIKVKDEILYELNKLFGDSAIPPYFGAGRCGAHITVMQKEELGLQIPISELGKIFQFNIASFDALKPGGFNGDKEVSFLALSAPELDSLRSHYGLTPKVDVTHDFHITFGVKYVNSN